MSLKDKLQLLRQAVQQKASIEQAIKYFCPLNAECPLFKLKILANRNNHDLVVLIKGLIEQMNPRDIETLISQLLAARESSLQVTIKEAKYEGEVYTCVFIDFPKQQ